MPWKRVIAWSAAVALSLFVLLVAGGYFVLQSARFHRYVLAKLARQLDESTGGEAEVRDFDLHLSRLTADVYELTIRGTEPGEQKPLLQVDKITIGLKILSVLHRQINLNSVVIVHPVAHLRVAKDGRNNIPRPKYASQPNSSLTGLFDLAVGHVLLSEGQIYYNDRPSSIDAEIYDLRTEIGFDPLATRYSGAISYHNGEIKYAGLKPLRHSLAAHFSATPAELKVSPLLLTLGSSRLALQAKLEDFSDPRVDGSYNLLIHTQDFAGINAGRAVGAISLSGTVHYRNLPDQPILRAVSLDGQLNSNSLFISSPQGRIELRRLFGRYQLSQGNLRARDLSAELLNGRLSANLSMQHVDATPAATLHAEMQGISIAAASGALKGMKILPLEGSIGGSCDASWVGDVSKLRAQADLGIHAAVLHQSTSGEPAAPLNGAIHLTYDGRAKLITVRDGVIRTPSTSMSAHGTVSTSARGHSSLSMHASTNNLHEVVVLTSAFQVSSGGQAGKSAIPPQLLSMSGTAILDSTFEGSLQDPRVHAQLKAQDLKFSGTQVRSLELSLQASSSGIEVQNGSLVAGKQAGAGQGQVLFSANLGLRDWSYSAANAVAASVSVKQMPIAQLQQLASVQYPFTGMLSASLVVQGSQLNPTGRGWLEIADANAYGEPIQNFKAQFQAANGSVASSLYVRVPAGSATANLAFVPKTKAYKVELNAPEIILAKVRALQTRNAQLAGTVRASASGSGTLDNPQLTATVEIPQLQLQQTTLSAIKAQVDIANRQADLSLTTSVSQAFLQAHAKVNLTGDYYSEAKIDSSKIPLGPLLAILAPRTPDGLTGETELHATLQGPLKDQAHLRAHLEIPVLTASYQQLKFGNSGPIRADYANSVVVLQRSEIEGTETHLRIAGRIPLNQSEGMNLNAQGSINLRLLGMVDSDVKSAGVIDLDVQTSGTSQRPEVAGEIHIRDASLATAAAPLGLDGLNGTLDLKNGQIRVTQLSGHIGGGELTGGGAVTYQPRLQFNLSLQGKSVRLRYPDGVRSILDSDLNLTGNMQEASVSGRVLVNGLSFTSDFDLSKFLNQFSGANVPRSVTSFADNVKLNVAVQSTGDLSATSSKVSIEGSLNLRLIGTASTPVIVGRTDLTSGDIFFMSRRYQLQRGIINFTNPNQIEPVVNLAIATTVEQYSLTLNITGPIDKLQINYSSDPPLAPVDVINLLALGQTTEEASTTSFGADSILASGVASGLGSGVQKLAGISSLQIDPLIGGNNTNPSARIALQQRVTKNFVFTFSTDVTQPQGEVVQGDYELSKRWSVSAERDEYGGFTAEGRFHTSF
jgi:translocation and assembly module TamB